MTQTNLLSMSFVGTFHLSRRVSDENRTCSIFIRFFKLTDPCVGRSFSMCSHHPIFGNNKIGSLKTDRVSGPLRYASQRHFTNIVANISLTPGSHWHKTICLTRMHKSIPKIKLLCISKTRLDLEYSIQCQQTRMPNN